jgi:hypothetical protein
MEGEINDVRAVGSEELEWYWIIGARYLSQHNAYSQIHIIIVSNICRWIPRVFVPDESGKAVPLLKSLSLLNLGGPGTYDPNVQKSFLFTFPTPTDHESLFWYTGRLKFGGSLKRMKVHAHNSVFQESIFFAASPEQLGLIEKNGFPQNTPHLTVNPTQIGYEDNAALKRFIIANLERSRRAFDSIASASKDGVVQNSGQCGFPHPPCREYKPAVVCQVFGRVEVIDGFAFDRRSPTSCDPWEWSSGQVFTVVGFSKHRGYPLGPHLPDVKSIPPELAGHVGYWLMYDSAEEPQQSHWSYSMYNHDPDGMQENVMDMFGYQKFALLINGHSSPHYTDWTKTPHSMVAMIVYSALTHAFITLVLVIIVVVMAARQLFKITMSFLRDAPHKKSDDLFCPTSGQEPTTFFLNSLGFGGGGGKKGSDGVELKRRGKPGEPVDEEQMSLLSQDDEDKEQV